VWPRPAGVNTVPQARHGPVCPAIAVSSTYLHGLSTGWPVLGGTSVSSPIIASVYALAGNAATVAYGSRPGNHASSLFDVTTSNSNYGAARACVTGVPDTTARPAASAHRTGRAPFRIESVAHGLSRRPLRYRRDGNGESWWISERKIRSRRDLLGAHVALVRSGESNVHLKLSPTKVPPSGYCGHFHR
jgi:hypothetical protein